jgi:hypothetical protein
MKLQLNFNKPGNYAFFCPVSKVHLTRSNPVGFVNEVTPYISRGLKSKSIIDVSDNTVTGQKTAKPEETKPEETQSVQTDEVKTTEAMPSTEPSTEEEPVAAPVEEVKEETVKVESEPTQQDAPVPSEKPKKGRQKKA